MTITPVGRRVLVSPEAEPDQTASGLHLVHHAKPEVAGVVVAVGRPSEDAADLVAVLERVRDLSVFDSLANEIDEALLVHRPRPLAVAVGDRVVFSWAVGQELRVGGERYLIIHEDDLLAVMEEDD